MIDVLVAGAGPTGLTLAAELARRGVSCRIIDKAPAGSIYSKAIAVQTRTLDVLERMGGPQLAEEAISRGLKVSEANIYIDNRKTAHIRLQNLIPGKRPYILTLAQSETEKLLSEHLKRFGISAERTCELLRFVQTDRSVSSVVRRADGREEALESRFLTGCDGAHSAVRHVLNMAFLGGEYQADFLLADARLKSNLAEKQAHAFLSDAGILGLFPLKDDHFRIIAVPRAGSLTQSESLSLTEMQTIVDSLSNEPLRLSDPRWLTRFRLHHRIVSHFRSGRVFLAGDAAHIHSPVGGQGMNTGIQDAYILAAKLAKVLKEGAPELVLDEYETARLPIAKAIVAGTDRATRLGIKGGIASRLIRSFLLPRMVRQEWLQRRIVSAASQAWVPLD